MVRFGTLSDVQRFASQDPFGGDREAEAREQRLWVEFSDTAELRGYASTARCTFHTNPYVEFLFVFPAFRRQRVASVLLDAIEAQFSGRRLFTSTEEPNDAMLTLLKRRGYTRAGAVQGLNDDHGGAAEVFFYRDV